MLPNDGVADTLLDMTLKNAAILAFAGTVLISALLIWNLVFDFIGVVRSLLPAARLFAAFIYAFGAVTVTVFFFVFQRRQP